MARAILTNSLPKLNLSRRHTAIFQKLILTGNQMSQVMESQHPLPVSVKRARLAERWNYWVVELAKMLL